MMMMMMMVHAHDINIRIIHFIFIHLGHFASTRKNAVQFGSITDWLPVCFVCLFFRGRGSSAIGCAKMPPLAKPYHWNSQTMERAEQGELEPIQGKVRCLHYQKARLWPSWEETFPTSPNAVSRETKTHETNPCKRFLQLRNNFPPLSLPYFPVHPCSGGHAVHPGWC